MSLGLDFNKNRDKWEKGPWNDNNLDKISFNRGLQFDRDSWYYFKKFNKWILVNSGSSNIKYNLLD